MSLGNGFYFAIGVLATVALLFVLYPWLAGKPRTALPSALPRWVPIAGVVLIAAALALYIRLGSPQLNDRDAVALATPERLEQRYRDCRLPEPSRPPVQWTPPYQA